MVTRLISSKSVVAKIMADLDMDEDNIRITDIREWIGEAIEKIGGIHQYGSKVSGTFNEEIIELKDYQAKLPCDLHSLNQVAYSRRCNGGWLPMRLTTNSFNRWSEPPCGNETNTRCPDGFMRCNRCNSCCGGRCYHDHELARVYMDMHKEIKDPHEAISEINHNINLRQTLVALITKGDTYGQGGFDPIHGRLPRGRHNTEYTWDLQYSLKPGYINANAKDGFLKLSYTAIPRDEHGYPMVPDLASVSEALYWYVTMKLLYPQYYRNLVPRDVYYDAKRAWNFHRGQAYAELLMPNTDGLKAIDNIWHKIYPEREDHEVFYSPTGDPQIIYRY